MSTSSGALTLLRRCYLSQIQLICDKADSAFLRWQTPSPPLSLRAASSLKYTFTIHWPTVNHCVAALYPQILNSVAEIRERDSKEKENRCTDHRGRKSDSIVFLIDQIHIEGHRRRWFVTERFLVLLYSLCLACSSCRTTFDFQSKFHFYFITINLTTANSHSLCICPDSIAGSTWYSILNFSHTNPNHVLNNRDQLKFSLIIHICTIVVVVVVEIVMIANRSDGRFSRHRMKLDQAAIAASVKKVRERKEM